jgi:hypothetical protein
VHDPGLGDCLLDQLVEGFGLRRSRIVNPLKVALPMLRSPMILPRGGGTAADPRVGAPTACLQNHPQRRLVVIGAVVGAIVGLATLDLHFIAGTGGRWLRPDNDFNAYLVSWYYFIADRWRFPVFSIPAMGYPEGGSVLFNDALPLTAIVTKFLFRVFGVLVNPFGWWIFLTYVLQGAMAARITRALGNRSVVAAVGAATFAVCCWPFMSRWGHTALSSHFLILWALALYFESVAKQRLPMAELLLVSAVTLLVNTYLFIMIVMLAGATALERWRHVRPGWREIGWLGLALFTLVAIGLGSGYGVMVTNPTAMKSSGFGYYSWNVISLLVPPVSHWGFPHLVRDATGGQYEGDTYIGQGAVLLLVLAVAMRPRVVLDSVRRHPMLAAVLVVCGFWAASNRIYIAPRLVLSVDLSPALLNAANYFRASGRFVWPLAYTVMLVPVTLIYRQCRPAIAIGLTLVAMTLQIVDVRSTVRDLRTGTATPPADLIDTRLVRSWVRMHQRVWQYPSWACGGLTAAPTVWGGADANRELQVQLVIARQGVPSNSVYTSRILKDCEQEAAWATHGPRLEDGVLYLFAPKAVATLPALAALTSASPCTTLNWVVACSTSWSTSPKRTAFR